MKDYSLRIILFFILMSSVPLNFIQGLEKNVQVQESASFYNKSLYADKIISEEYKEGPFLIYDCAGKFWACVDTEGFKSCQDKRKEASAKAKTNLACTPIQEFNTSSLCFLSQQKMVDFPRPVNFCLYQEDLELNRQ